MSTNLPEKIDPTPTSSDAWKLKQLIERYNQLLDYLAEREKTITRNPCSHTPSHFPYNMIACDDQRTTKL